MKIARHQVEICRLKNRKLGPLGMLHPVQLHLVNFQILDVTGTHRCSGRELIQRELLNWIEQAYASTLAVKSR